MPLLPDARSLSPGALNMARVLEGRVALITGAASGIGLEIARAFARAGARIAIADLDAQGAHRAAAELNGAESAVLCLVRIQRAHRAIPGREPWLAHAIGARARAPMGPAVRDCLASTPSRLHSWVSFGCNAAAVTTNSNRIIMGVEIERGTGCTQ